MKNLNYTLKLFNEMFKCLNKNNDIPIQKNTLNLFRGLTTGCFVEKLNETIQFIKSKCLFPGNWD